MKQENGRYEMSMVLTAPRFAGIEKGLLMARWKAFHARCLVYTVPAEHHADDTWSMRVTFTCASRSQLAGLRAALLSEGRKPNVD